MREEPWGQSPQPQLNFTSRDLRVASVSCQSHRNQGGVFASCWGPWGWSRLLEGGSEVDREVRARLGGWALTWEACWGVSWVSRQEGEGLGKGAETPRRDSTHQGPGAGNMGRRAPESGTDYFLCHCASLRFRILTLNSE